MEASARRQLRIAARHPRRVTQPHGRVRRTTVHPPGLPRIDAMVCTPPIPHGVTLHFVGFNTLMGPWEAAKGALWADITKSTVVMCELPGFSRHGDPLPARMRMDLLEGNPVSWASATLACLKTAMQEASITEPDRVDLLGFSTGCSLVTAALPAILATYPVATLTLVEPVSLRDRTLGTLARHNFADLIRLVKTIPDNRESGWIGQAAKRQFTEPPLKFALADFLAVGAMLASDDTLTRVDSLDLPHTMIARGAVSKLCPPDEFAALDDLVTRRGIPGATCVIEGFGHQLWHSVPVLDALARALFAPDARPAIHE